MSGYWLKLYVETLDDIKYYRLSNDAKLAMFELLMVAKRTGDDGLLPPFDEVIFITHGSHSEEWWLNAIGELREIDFLVEADKGWKIRKFEERQAKVNDSERQRESRKRKHQEEYRDTNNEEENNSCHEPVTNTSRIVMEKERKIDIDTEREEERKKDDASLSDAAVSPEQLKAWQMAMGDMEREIPRASFQAYFKDLALMGVQDNTFEIGAVNKFAAEKVRVAYGEALKGCIQGYYGKPVKLMVTA